VKPVQPPPPQSTRPWYYQRWFLFVAFFLWPLWPMLVLRSPWHNSLLAGAVAWAILFSGGFLVVVRLSQLGTVAYSTVLLVLPGLGLTVVTQTLWARRKRELAAIGQPPTPSPSSGIGPGEGLDQPGRWARRRLRRRSRGGSHPGRYPRHSR
jgi:hypothetical protein